MFVTRSFLQLTGVIAAIAITLGLVTAPTPAARPFAESAAAVQTVHLEVATVGLETVLADVVTGVVNAAKTAVFVLVSPILVPATVWSFFYRMWGAGFCAAPCNRDADQLWQLSEFIGQVWSYLSPSSTPGPAAVGVVRVAETVTVGDPGRQADRAAVNEVPVATPQREGRATALVERASRADATPSRRGTAQPASKRPAAAATLVADGVETSEPSQSKRGSAMASASRAARTAATTR